MQKSDKHNISFWGSPQIVKRICLNLVAKERFIPKLWAVASACPESVAVPKDVVAYLEYSLMNHHTT